MPGVPIRFIIREPECEVIISLILHKWVMTNIFHDFNTHLNKATNHKVHISNHGGPITFIALSAALKGALASS